MIIAKALTIAGSDSGGGAGVQADLKTFSALGVYGSSVVTAVTAQNTRAVSHIHVVPPEVVEKQLVAVLEDIGATAIKTGMLATREIIRAVVSTLRPFPGIPLVVDPVMVAKSGDWLLAPEAIQALKEELLPRATIVTPNIPEAAVLVGRSLESEGDYAEAARAIFEMGPRIVVLKGGHRPRPKKGKRGSHPASAAPAGCVTVGRLNRNEMTSKQVSTAADSDRVIDLYFDGLEMRPVEGPLVETPHSHGTGCTFASAITAGLARGLEPYLAVCRARQYLTEALRHAFAIGNGRGPVHHFHGLWL